MKNARAEGYVLVDPAPLRPFLRQAAAGTDLNVGDKGRHVQSGQRALARRYGKRYGVELETACRILARILSPKTKGISHITADRWCCLIGLHPVLLWPELWREDAA